jgi:hypothetical protein
MLRENATIVVARNERWSGNIATEPVECGWACEAMFFIRKLGDAPAVSAEAKVQVSPDGMHWTDLGPTAPLPGSATDVTAIPVSRFGNWLRLSVELPEGAAFVALVTLHLK